MASVRKVKFFKCESCGSSKVIKKDSDSFCDYCDSQFVYEKPVEVMPFFRIAIIILVAITGYIGYKTVFSPDAVKSIYNTKQKITKIQTPTQTTKKIKQTKQVPHTANNRHIVGIKEMSTSVLSPAYKQKREAAFTPWLSQPEYQNRFNDGYYKRRQTYAAYVELDGFGNRRVLELPLNLKERKYSFYYTVKSGRDLRNIQKTHLNRSVNGKTLLSLSSYVISETTLYCATWVSSWAYKDEVARLAEYGIFPPKSKNEILYSDTSFLEGKNTLLTLGIQTANKKDAATNDSVYISINHHRPFRLELQHGKARRRGALDYYRFRSDIDIKNIRTITLNTKGYDAWRVESISVALLDKNNQKKRYKSELGFLLSSEKRDIVKLNAKPSYTLQLSQMEALPYTK